jgi:cytochrome c-type biogenesis protein CcmF
MNRPVAMPVRAIVSPMVVWIWVGGAIALAGSLLALWPTRAGKRREVASAYKARLGSELTRA